MRMSLCKISLVETRPSASLGADHHMASDLGERPSPSLCYTSQLPEMKLYPLACPKPWKGTFRT